jgi:outer membrane protein, heavy metal efflux system
MGRVPIAILACALAPTARAVEEPPPLTELPPHVTLDAALGLFRERGLDLLIAEAAVEAARADVLLAGATPNPILSGGVAYSFGYDASCIGCSAFGWSAGLTDNAAIVDRVSGKRGLRIAVAEKALEAAKMARADAQRTLEFQVKEQYIQAVQARDALDFSLEVQKHTTRSLELNQVRYKAGAISEADEAKVETVKLEADQAVAGATQNLRLAKVGLAFLLGVRGPVPDYTVDQDLPKYAVPAPLQQATADTLFRDALEHRADRRGLGFQRERAETAIASARRLRVPDLALSAGFTAQGSGQLAIQPPTLLFGVSVPLPLLYRYQGEIARARADLTTQKLEMAKIDTQIAAEVTSAFTSFTGTRELVERMESRLLDRARRARDLVAIQYEKGSASLLEYLDAQRTFVNINVEYLQDLTSYWIAVFQLEQAVGMELRK